MPDTCMYADVYMYVLVLVPVLVMKEVSGLLPLVPILPEVAADIQDGNSMLGDD